ncbi:MAG: NAD(P)H-binding protein [Chloroflexi bacterium]|nr:NAD(P)H-binding protein [Chloroflexota bacterium]
MAEAKQSLNVFVTGGAEGVGLAAVRALMRRGHKVVATACDAEGALAVRLAGALPVYPDLSRASEVLSNLELAKADAVVHAGPQFYGGLPHASLDYVPYTDQLVSFTAAVIQAAKAHRVHRFVSLSFGYLYEAAHGAAKEGDRDARDSDYAPMLEAETILRDSGLDGFIIRSGYIYGGNSDPTAALAKSIKKSRTLPSGAKSASWIHEDDLAAAIVSLLEAESNVAGVETINAADDAPRSPDEFVGAMCDALGLSAPGFAGDGFLAVLRQKTFRDKLLEREIVINSDALRHRFAWHPGHSKFESGLEATALTWRMKDAVDADDFYNDYQDKAAEAIASFVYDAVLPEPVPEAETSAPAPAGASAEPAPAKAAAPPSSDGPTPWNEDDAKREERRRKALERKAKRAARQSGGS